MTKAKKNKLKKAGPLARALAYLALVVLISGDSLFGEDYIRKVRELVLDTKERKRLGEFAQSRAEREFLPSALIKSHIEMFDEILRR